MNSIAVDNRFASHMLGPESCQPILLNMMQAFVVELRIARVYRENFCGVMYSPNFALKLALTRLVASPAVICVRKLNQLMMPAFSSSGRFFSAWAADISNVRGAALAACIGEGV